MVADQTDIWTPTDQIEALGLGDLASMDYADLLDSLRKDLQLDAATDLVPGSVWQTLSGLQVQWAVIDARTPPPIIVNSSPGMQVTRSAVGRYVVTFGTPFNNNPAVVASTTWVAGTNHTDIAATTINPTFTDISVDVSGAVTAVDDYFTVIAVGTT